MLAPTDACQWFCKCEQCHTFRLRRRAPAVCVLDDGRGAEVRGAVFFQGREPTALLGEIVPIAAGIGSPGFGAALLLAFALGRAIPVLLGAIAVGWLEDLAGLRGFHKAFEVIGGVLLILSGLYMLNAYFIVVPSLAAQEWRWLPDIGVLTLTREEGLRCTVRRRNGCGGGADMNRDPEHGPAKLGEMVLMAFEYALLHRQASVAEHLLCALEELARTETQCRATLDRAYLLIGRSDLKP